MKSFKALGIFFVFCLLAQPSVASSSKNKTRIGVIFRLHDEYNTFPQHMLESMKFAIDYLKLRERIELIPVSHDGSAVSLKKAVDLLRGKGVSVFVGGETSSDAILIAKFLPKENVLFVTPTASSHKIFESNSNSYRMMLDGSKMKHLVREVVVKESCSLLGVVHNVSKPNANYISNTIMKDKFLKGQVKLANIKVLADEKKFEAKISIFKELGVDCVAIFSFESDLRKFVSFMKKANYFPIIIGGDGWGSNKNVMENYSSTVNKFKAYRSMYWNENDNTDFSKAVKTAYLKYTGKKMNAFTAIAFDTIKLLGHVTSKKTAVPIHSMHKSLRSQNFNEFLTSRSLKFDSMGSPLKSLHTYQINKVRAHYWTSIHLEK